MHDGMPYGRNQGQGQGHSREVDRQSPTGLILQSDHCPQCILRLLPHLTSCVGGHHNMPPPLQVDLESGVRVTCDVDYLCANFNLPRPLFST